MDFRIDFHFTVHAGESLDIFHNQLLFVHFNFQLVLESLCHIFCSNSAEQFALFACFGFDCNFFTVNFSLQLVGSLDFFPFVVGFCTFFCFVLKKTYILLIFLRPRHTKPCYEKLILRTNS